MTRKLSVLFVLAFFVMSLGSMAVAANAKNASQGKLITNFEAIPKTMTLSDDVSGDAASSGKPVTAPRAALGYFMLGDVQVGSTEFDYQSNDRQQRQVTIGSDNRIHTIWINREFGADPKPRTIFYNGFRTVGTPFAPMTATFISPLDGNGGYGSIAIGPTDTLAVVAYHYTMTPGVGHVGPYDTRPRLHAGRQADIFAQTFIRFNYPNADTIMPNILNCQGILTSGTVGETKEGGYIWPSLAADRDPVSGKTIAHILAKESPVLDTSGKASLVYFKTLPDAVVPTATCGFLLDSMSSNINYDIAASPVSDKVAAVYLYPKTWVTIPAKNLGDNDDVYYRESSDLGATWGARTPIRIFDATDSISSSGMMFYMRGSEVSALYDDNNNLHVLYLAYWAAPVDHYYLILPARLYHWSSNNPTCQVMLVDGNGTWGPSTGRPPLGQQLMAKISLTQCTVGATKRLYAVYTMYPDSTGLTGNTYSDRSTTPILNGEVVAQGSIDLNGELWGPMVNLSNTRSDGCTSALSNCFSEGYTNAAPYTNDSMRIQFLVDKDAGSAVQTSTSNPQGVLSDNPVIVKGYQCYSIATEAILSVSPTEILYPFHTTAAAGPNHTAVVPAVLTNVGNTPAVYTRTVVYTPAVAAWLGFANSASSSCPAGCTQTQAETITATGPAAEGLYKAEITWSYTGSKTLKMNVELYNYNDANWIVELNNSIRTTHVRMAVNQTSRVSAQKAGFGFRYFADGGDTSYMYDGSLMIGTSSTALSMGVFEDSAGIGGHLDPNIGRLFGLTAMTFDSATFSSYRKASGTGCNEDSTIAFDAEFLAPKHVDSASFMVGKFSLYAGPKNPAATINNVMVGYAADWDVPDDSADNSGGVDAALQMVYQKGKWGTNVTRFGALSGWREDAAPVVAGMVVANIKTIYRLRGYVADSLWTKIQNTNTFTSTQMNYPTTTFDTSADLNSMLIFSKTATIKPAASGKFTVYVIFAGQPKAGGSLAGLQGTIAKAKKFMCSHWGINPALCAVACNSCGDANGDAVINISDAVYLIAYIFAGGAAPGDCNYPFGKGDANGDTVVNISDAVYLIAYIFAGGAAPHCNGM
jgi:hypothetical protein